ncbi:MAG: hypothetical protein JWM25_5 [Thermoleophilia bacterium]|nr:hypothetical protein [Thermoleophilia bacterium]
MLRRLFAKRRARHEQRSEQTSNVPVRDTPSPSPSSRNLVTPVREPSGGVSTFDAAAAANPVSAADAPATATEPPRRRLTLPARAPRSGLLPPAGSSQLAGVQLPPGRQVGRVLSDAHGVAALDLAGAVLWVTAVPVEAPLGLFSPLAAAFPETGLWPLLTRTGPGPLVDGDWVDGHEGIQRPEPSPPQLDELLAPEGVLLQPSGRASSPIAALREASVPSRVALVSCTTPVQAITHLAWHPDGSPTHPALLGAVLESWEQRYGALLVGLDASSLLLVIARPPATHGEALATAAEHAALGVLDASDAATRDDYATALVDSALWRLRW